MGRAIAVLSVIVLCSFAAVFLHLWAGRGDGAEAAVTRRPAQMLVPREDGSIYSVSLELSRFERRLMEEEKRSQQLQGEVEALRKERETLESRVTDLQSELRRMRRELRERPAEPEPDTPAPANAPPDVPANGPPLVPTPDSGQ